MSTAVPLAERSTPRNSSGARNRIAFVLSFLLLMNFLYFFLSSGRVRTIDEVSAAFQVESLATHETTAIPQAVEAKEFYGRFDRFGRPQSPYPPGQAVALLPWYAAGRFFGKHFLGVPAALRDVFSDFFLTGESAFFSALAAALALFIFLKLGITPEVSLLASGIVALATPIAVYSGWLFSEPLATALLLAAAAVAFPRWLVPLASPDSGKQEPDALTSATIDPIRQTGDPVGEVSPRIATDAASSRVSVPLSPGVWRALAAGALLGAALWIRPTHVIAVPVFLAALLIRERGKGWRAPAAIVVAAGVSAALLLWRNAYLHGSLFDFGYPAAAEGGKALNMFETPLATGLLGFLASPGKSIFLFSPPILLAMLGLPRLWRRDRGLAVVAAFTPVVYLFFFSRYTQWEGGYCYGPRYLVPALALLALGIAPALEAASRNTRLLAIGVFVAGFFVQAIGSLTSFLEAAIAGTYYDARYNYRMSFSPIAMHIHLLARYANSEPAPLGQGFDKWWVFLSKAGVPSTPLICIGGILLVGTLGSAWSLWRANRTLTDAL